MPNRRRETQAVLAAMLLLALPACGGDAGVGDSGMDARAGSDAAVAEDTGRELPDTDLQLDAQLLDRDADRDAQLLDRDGSLLDLDGSLLDRDGSLLDRDGSLLDRDGALLCAPMDARGEGVCDLALGIVWNGSACVPISGCSCVGADCADLFRTDAACRLRYAACLAASGTFTCGTARMCSLASEYCAIANIGPAIRYSCQPLPDTCLRDVSCATCFPSPGAAICTGDATTGLTVDDGRG
ncbi:MAG: hypothetical protein K1X94_35520 [Sandaracinaceae bacterium]|nr:hypothetical protein [Sandaracinaceae bacterium]